jgi:hypothetical protein
MKSVVTISRKWHRPEITTTIDVEGIVVTIPLFDFCEALQTEIGSVTWVFKDKTFRARFDDAVQQVLSGVKEETAKVV